MTPLLVPTLITLLHCWRVAEGTAIDNEIAGEPEVACAEDSVTFSMRSRNRFTGNIFIKGQYDTPACRQEYFSNTFDGASFTVRIGECGMRRIRQLQPVGMNYMLVFVVNFHSQFITKVDKAYNVRCFYAQEDKTVTNALEVSMLPTTEFTAQTIIMPDCEYSVRQDTLNGPKVRFAQVGDRLVHRWECDNPNFGMLVKNCFVNDGQGSSVRVLDSRGCPVFTPVIQGTLNYDTNLNLAYVEVWAYKFPDKADLFFQCQIQVCNKRENECLGITPPNCPLVNKSDFTPNSDTRTDAEGRVVVEGTFQPGLRENVLNSLGNLRRDEAALESRVESRNRVETRLRELEANNSPLDNLPTNRAPSNIPTNLPSNIPTNLPRNIPTNLPRNIPTNLPSNIPTNLPQLLNANRVSANFSPVRSGTAGSSLPTSTLFDTNATRTVVIREEQPRGALERPLGGSLERRPATPIRPLNFSYFESALDALKSSEAALQRGKRNVDEQRRNVEDVGEKKSERRNLEDVGETIDVGTEMVTVLDLDDEIDEPIAAPARNKLQAITTQSAPICLSGTQLHLLIFALVSFICVIGLLFLVVVLQRLARLNKIDPSRKSSRLSLSLFST